MHVLILPSWYPRDLDDLSGSFFREQAEALNQAGLQIGVLAPIEITPWEQPRDFAKLIFKPQQTAQFENEIPVLRFEAPHPFPKALRANALAAAPAIKAAFRNYVRRWGTPDLIHAHSLFPGAFYAQLLSKSYGIPFVYTEHRSLNHLDNSRSQLKSQKRVALGAARRWGVSPGHSTHIAQRLAMPKASWGNIANLLPAHFTATVPRTRDKNSPLTIGHLSVLDPVKEVPELIAAFTAAFPDPATTLLSIAGDGAERSTLEKLAAESSAGDRIRFTGNVSRTEVPDFLAQLDLFVLPSSSEPFGVVLIEALSQGVPILTTETWGGSDVAQSVDGRIIPVGDRSALIAALEETEAPTQQERTRLREKTIARFGRSIFVAKTIAEYQAALDGELR